MAKITESTLAVHLERQGRTLTKVTKWEIDSDYVTSTDGFSFTAYAENLAEVDDLELEPVRLSVAGADQLVGRIDGGNYGENGSAVEYTGRDYIADFVEDNIDTRLIFAEGTTLSDVVLGALGPHGVTDVAADSDVLVRNIRTGRDAPGTPNPDYKEFKVKDLKPDNGDGTYETLNKYLARFRCTMQPTPNDRSKVLLTSPNYSGDPLYSLVRRKSGGGAGNNIVTGRKSRDFSSVPSIVWFDGTDTKSGETGTALSRKIDVASSTRAIDPALAQLADVLDRSQYRGLYDGSRIREPGLLYRLLRFRDKDAKTTQQLEAAAFRALYDRLKQTFVYTATVQGHTDPVSGAVWSIDTLCRVDDEVARVADTLWIAKRTLKFDAESGATTDLVMWLPKLFLPTL